MDYLGLATNLANIAITQYCHFNFNSMCKFGDVYLGANEDGIHTLGGGTDNGTDIDAFLELALSDWGISEFKRIRRLFIGYETNGNLLFTIKDDEDDSWTATLEYHRFGYDRQTGNEIDGRRDKVGRYWSIRIDNIDGAEFAIDSIEVLAVILSRRPK